MRLYELIEARRNPSQNDKKTGHEGALQLLSSIKFLNNYGISMTSLPKLGINPHSTYNTPLGVYFYPANYYYDTKKKHEPLEFMDEAKYIQILKITGNILHIDTMDHNEYQQCIKTLMGMVPTLSSNYGLPGDWLYTYIASVIRTAPSEARVDSYGGYLWNILYNLSTTLARAKTPTNTTKKVKPKNDDDDDDDDIYKVTPQKVTMAERDTIIWNKLLRQLGYDAVMDAEAIIHENEPVQGVVLNPSKIQHIATIDNSTRLDRKDAVDQNKVYLEREPTRYWLQRAYAELYTCDKRAAKKLANYAVNVIKKFPELSADLTIIELENIAKISENRRALDILMQNKAIMETLKSWVQKNYGVIVTRIITGEITEPTAQQLYRLRDFRDIFSKHPDNKSAAYIVKQIDTALEKLKQRRPATKPQEKV